MICKITNFFQPKKIRKIRILDLCSSATADILVWAYLSLMTNKSTANQVHQCSLYRSSPTTESNRSASLKATTIARILALYLINRLWHDIQQRYTRRRQLIIGLTIYKHSNSPLHAASMHITTLLATYLHTSVCRHHRHCIYLFI